tara:strand:+ start:708 stop:1751 length:1044 start_codon:yes stop_codon:yes gene_type:complete
VVISDKKISLNDEPFIIAEMSGNHDQSFKKAMRLVELAAESGAHALKLQTYTADTMTINSSQDDFKINDEKSLWHGYNLYELYQKAYTPWEWHEPIMERANELGLICFSSPFDSSAVDFLEDLNVPAYKVASFENLDYPLIEKVIKTGKPIIISSGLADLSELSSVVNFIKDNGCDELMILKCTSSYPASPEESNVSTIKHMRSIFGCEIGLSDHTMGIGVAIASLSFGATAIEKHFTSSREEKGVDSDFSLEPSELRDLVVESKRAWQAIGNFKLGPTESEIGSLQFKRSIYICEDIEIGEQFTNKNIRVIRPGFGLSPKFYDIILGKKSNRKLKKGTPLSWDFMG